jgi:hypothetical protein
MSAPLAYLGLFDILTFSGVSSQQTEKSFRIYANYHLNKLLTKIVKSFLVQKNNSLVSQTTTV